MPTLIDLCCGAGGSAKGFYRAGFTRITGIDVRPQPRYPFKFIQRDAMEVLRDKEYLDQFDAVNISPPCQKYTKLKHLGGPRGRELDLLHPAIELLEGWHKPYAIENVENADFGCKTFHLCGSMFNGLSCRNGTRQLQRHRQFKVNFPIDKLYCQHNGLRAVGVYGDLGFTGPAPSYTEYPRSLAEAEELMGIDWMLWRELREAIPPAYTRYIGRFMLKKLNG